TLRGVRTAPRSLRGRGADAHAGGPARHVHRCCSGRLRPFQLDWLTRHSETLAPSRVGTGFAAPADLLEVKSTLAGVVLEDGLVKAGDQVDDAQPLVYVRTPLTGTIGVAARAPRDGVIGEVLVQPGQRIERGDIVIR